MAMTIDCDKLVSMSGCVTPPPPAVNFIEAAAGPHEEEVATPKLVAGAGQMDGIMADALNSKLQQLQEQIWSTEEARIVPTCTSGEKITLGNDFVKVPLPGQQVQQTSVPMQMLPPPPMPHSVQRPPKDPRFRPIPDRANVVISKGSVGHPMNCAAACKYVKRKGGCRDGADCLLCHECFWSKSSSKEVETRKDGKAEAEAAMRTRQFTTEEDSLTDKFARLLATQEHMALAPQMPLRQDMYPADLGVVSLGALGHPLGSSIQSTPEGSIAGVEGVPPPGLEFPAMPMSSLMNPGSLGHPFSCGPACKYVLKTRGCKDGDSCNHCHLCRWTRYSAKTMRL